MKYIKTKRALYSWSRQCKNSTD